MALCVVIHATGSPSRSGRCARTLCRRPRAWRWVWLFIRIAGWIVLLHLLEIGAWAVVYVWDAAIPDLQSALYFSAVTYTTTGYGDLVLSKEWRLVGAIEALTGILMCGWSTGFFFAVVSRLNKEEGHRAARGAAEPAPPSAVAARTGDAVGGLLECNARQPDRVGDRGRRVARRAVSAREGIDRRRHRRPTRLFMLGMSFLLGGLKHHVQEFNRDERAHAGRACCFSPPIALLDSVARSRIANLAASSEFTSAI